MINNINSGLEEFEEKIDKIAEGEDDGENSWISKIYNQFSFFNDGENSLEENDMDGLEPPLLDETWGLGVRTGGKGEKRTPQKYGEEKTGKGFCKTLHCAVCFGIHLSRQSFMF